MAWELFDPLPLEVDQVYILYSDWCHSFSLRHVDERKPAGRVHNNIDKRKEVYAGSKVSYFYRGRDIIWNHDLRDAGCPIDDFDYTSIYNLKCSNPRYFT